MYSSDGNIYMYSSEGNMYMYSSDKNKISFWMNGENQLNGLISQFILILLKCVSTE